MLSDRVVLPSPEPPAGVSVHLVMPWFLPLAALTAWLGLRAVRDIRAEGEEGHAGGWWMLILTLLPLVFWLIAQARPGERTLR